MSNKKTSDKQVSKSIVENIKNERDTLAFSFLHITNCEQYGFRFLEKTKDELECYKQVFDKIRKLSQIPFDEIKQAPKKVGFEYIPIEQFDKTFINSISNTLSKKKIVVARLSDRGRIYMTIEQDKIAYILGIDYLGKAYSH